MHKVTIAHVCSSGGWGGLEMYPLVLAQKQRTKGYEVLLVARRGTRLAHFLDREEIPHRLLGVKGYFFPLAALRLKRIIECENVGVLHIHLPKDVALSYVVSKLTQRRVVKIFHKHLATGVRKLDPVHRILYRNLDLTIAVSRYVKQSLVIHCPLKEEDIEVVECGIDLDKWRTDEADTGCLKREYGLSASNVLVGLVGRLDPRKGQEDFTRAAALLGSKYPQVRFLIVGDSPDERYKRHLEKLSHDLGMEKRVIFTGHRDDMPSVIGGLDMVVAPSKEESFGLVVIEAMALKKPVIVTNTGAFPEFVSHRITGRVVNWNDPKGLSEAIEANILNPEESRAMVERAYQLVKERFDLNRTVDRLGDLYHSLLRQKGLT